MRCDGCGNEDAWAVHPKKESFTGKIYEECNRCFDPSIPQVPDVYFREPYWDPNLCDYDDPSYDKDRGTFVRSRDHKAYLLKKLNLREDGDRKGGSRAFDPSYHRRAMKSLLERRLPSCQTK